MAWSTATTGSTTWSSTPPGRTSPPSSTGRWPRSATRSPTSACCSPTRAPSADVDNPIAEAMSAHLGWPDRADAGRAVRRDRPARRRGPRGAALVHRAGALQARRHLRGHPLPLHPGADRRRGVRPDRRPGRTAVPRRPARARHRVRGGLTVDFAPDATTLEHAAPPRGVHGRAGLPGRARVRGAGRGRPPGRRPVAPPAVVEELKAEARRRGPVEPVPARRARRRSDQPAVRAAGRDHRPLTASGPRGAATAPPPTPATWRCWPSSAPPSSRSAGWRRCSTARIRSAFCMTEPDVASSDATNIATRIRRDGDEYVVNGRKWWSTGAMDPRAEIFVVMGRSADPDDESVPRHEQQSMVLVPRDTPGVTVVRGLHRLRLRRRRARRARRGRVRRRPRPGVEHPPRARARGSRSRRPGSAPDGSTTACA